MTQFETIFFTKFSVSTERFQHIVTSDRDQQLPLQDTNNYNLIFFSERWPNGTMVRCNINSCYKAVGNPIHLLQFILVKFYVVIHYIENTMPDHQQFHSISHQE